MEVSTTIRVNIEELMAYNITLYMDIPQNLSDADLNKLQADMQANAWSVAGRSLPSLVNDTDVSGGWGMAIVNAYSTVYHLRFLCCSLYGHEHMSRMVHIIF